MTHFDLQRELDQLEAEDPMVRAASEGLDEVYEYLKGRLPTDQVAEIYGSQAVRASMLRRRGRREWLQRQKEEAGA